MNTKMLFKHWRTIAVLVLPLLFVLPAHAQNNGQLKGVVISELGGEISGATVELYTDSSTRVSSRSSDEKGAFSFENLKRGVTYRVEATMLGFRRSSPHTVTIKPTGANSILIRLAPASEDLDAVVVVGYGQVKKKDLTGAVSSVNGDDLKNIPVPRVDQMLQGRAPGVQVTSTTGAPGAGTTIRIRGSRSVSASNEPLYVIDGIVGAGDLNTINPADIQSIDVLKDASSAAIYGSRASNGVIIITTKQGKVGKDRFSFSATHGISNVPKLVDMMEAKDFVSFVNEAYVDEGQAPLYPNVDSILAITGD
ncbi:MAG: TonB-dependent receptor plug domain-containing protein, partial [Sphingobacterium sp.]